MAIDRESEGRSIGGVMGKFQRQWEQRRIADAQEEMRRQREARSEEAKNSGSSGKSERKKDSGPASQSGLNTPSASIAPIGSNAASTPVAGNSAGGSMPKGGAGSISPSALYSYLIDRGATRNQAIMLTGAAGAESTWHPNLSHDKGTGYGLWGHRAERWDAMANMAGDRHPNWQKQADYALWELNNSRDGGIRRANAELARASTPEQIAIAQMHFERPVGYRPDNPQGGHNFSGRLALVRQIDSGSFGGRSTTPATLAPATPTQDAGTTRARYAQADTGAKTDATPRPATPTTPMASTPQATTPQAQPATVTPGSQPPTADTSLTPAPPMPPRRPNDLGQPPAPLPPRRPDDLGAQPAPPASPAAPADSGKGLGGFFDNLFGNGEPIKDQYGRVWDGFEGWVDPKAGGSTAETFERANAAAKANDAPSMLERSSAATSSTADSPKSIFSDMPDIGSAFSPALNFFSSLFG